MLDGIHKIHLIGIGGSGMRAIANILIQKGYDVSGSDVADSAVIEKFRNMGATVHIGHNKDYVKGVDAVVRSTAIREDNPEIVAAKEQGITILHRSDIVKAVLDVTDGIAVAGAHGKTSTTSMIGQILVEADADPTVIIGGEVDYLKGSSCLGKGHFSVVEADESDGSFLKLRPHTIVITNIEDDHMDHYKTMDNLLNAFCEFVETLPESGKAIVCGDNENIRYVMSRVNRNFITYGLSDNNDYVAKNIHYVDSTLVYDVYHKGVNIERIRLRVPGEHNVLNSLAAFIVAHDCCGVETRIITKGLGKFIGAKRRFETKGHVAGVWVVDDYAHHPSEIKATIDSARRKYADKQIVAIFQPHTYTRTAKFLNEFAKSLLTADKVFLCPIFASVREKEKIVGIEDLQKVTPGSEIIHGEEDFDKLNFDNTVFLFMGAGNINKLCHKFFEKNTNN